MRDFCRIILLLIVSEWLWLQLYMYINFKQFYSAMKKTQRWFNIAITHLNIFSLVTCNSCRLTELISEIWQRGRFLPLPAPNVSWFVSGDWYKMTVSVDISVRLRPTLLCLINIRTLTTFSRSYTSDTLFSCGHIISNKKKFQYLFWTFEFLIKFRFC